MTKTLHGRGAARYWLFEPADPVPASAPLIAMLHGWAEINPQPYGAWIEHLVRQGNIVVFPRYQNDALTLPDRFTDHAAEAISDAVTVLQQDGHVMPDLARFALVGHSVGGNVAANLAARGSADGLPHAGALLCAHPGINAIVPLEDMSRIRADTLVLTITGDRDHITGKADARRIYQGATPVPAERKNFVVLQSDRHGKPALVADHAAPLAMDKAYDSGVMKAVGRGRKPPMLSFHLPWHRAPDALDYYGYWRLFDALCDAAFEGRHIEYALGNTPQQRDMGTWSDGVAVKELVVVEQP
ncbi:MAG: alpha/beta hydrolase fold domain-containing protein [Phycisphaeraceae bacterium]